MPEFARITGRQLLPHLRRIQGDPLGFLSEITRREGDLVHFDLGRISAFLVNTPEGVKHILLDNARNYSKNTIQYNALATVTGRGLLTSDGEEWLRHRRIEQPAFARPRLAALDGVVVPAGRGMLARWDAAYAAGAALDLDREMMQVALEVVGQALFSIDLSTDAPRLTQAVLTALDHIIYRAKNQIVPPDWVPTPRNLRFQRALRMLDAAIYELIAGRRQAASPGEDLLGLLLAAALDPQTGQALTDRQLRDEVITLLIAGHETVASALTWAFYLLWLNPPAWQQMQAEVRQVLGGRLPTSADLPALDFTGRVFQEALRLYPPAWLITRQAIAPDEICGCPIPAGALMILSPYVLQRSPALWRDPLAFDPDRFQPGGEAQPGRFAYIPFGGGPRLCIGSQFAQVEATLILAMVAQRYRPVLPPGASIQVDALVTLRPHGGLPVRLEKM